MAERTTHTCSAGTFEQSPREGMNALAYSFHRIGRCIASGGRRMERLMLNQRAVLKRPDVEGRFTKRGAFKETIKALRMRGLPSEQGYETGGGAYATGRRIRYEDLSVFHPHTRSSRAERRAAARTADKAHRASLRAVPATNGGETHLPGEQLQPSQP